ncbi:MAG: hypothetical protein IKJ26_00505 [Clostridia bacterium]|nr:hypothetical protein [Clostridia bacterium]
MTACNYPVSHQTEVSSTAGEGIIHIDYEVGEEEQAAFSNAVSYQLHDNGAKLYIYKEGTYDANATLGTGSVATLEAKNALSFQATGKSAYRLSIRYTGLENGNYEIHWDCDFSGRGTFFFKALDANGNALTYSIYDRTESEFYSYDHYQTTPDAATKNIVFSVGAEAPTQTPTETPTPSPTTPVGTPAPTPPCAALPPKTGDSATPLLWAQLLILGAVGIVIVYRQKAHR